MLLLGILIIFMAHLSISSSRNNLRDHLNGMNSNFEKPNIRGGENQVERKNKAEIPQVIWQTAKSHNAPAAAAKIMSTWRSMNPAWDQRLLDDSEILSFMKQHFNTSVVNAFVSLPVPVMRADFFRLAVMYHEGGVYADVDVECNVPIHDWQYDDYGSMMDSCSVVIGMENRIDTSIPGHVSNWGFASVKQHLLFQKAIEISLSRFLKQGVDVNKKQFVHHTTGPELLTDALKYLATEAGCEWDSYLPEDSRCEWDDNDNPCKHALVLYDICRFTLKDKYNICYVDDTTQMKWFQNHYSSQKNNLQSEDWVSNWTKTVVELNANESMNSVHSRNDPPVQIHRSTNSLQTTAGGNRPVKTADAVPLFTTHRNCSLWKYSKQWQDLGYDTECMDDTRVMQIVASYCQHRPREMIQYADIARLLILYENGGWYVDSDVRPTPRCGTLQSFSQTTFGLESDFSTKSQAGAYGMLQQSLSLWAFYGVKGDERLLQNARILSSRAEQKRKPGESLHAYILRSTGPTIQTQLWNGTVLPVSVFGCGQRHSRSPPCYALSCWGCHEFNGSWIRGHKELARYSGLLVSNYMDIDAESNSLSILISSWSKMISVEHKKPISNIAVDIVKLPKSDDSAGVKLLFRKGNGGRSAYNEQDNESGNVHKKKEREEPTKEGGIKVMIHKTPDGDLEVIANRCEIGDETEIKEMNEQMIIKSLGQAIQAWKKEQSKRPKALGLAWLKSKIRMLM